MVVICVCFTIIVIGFMAFALFLYREQVKRVDNELARFSVLSESCMRYLVSKSAMEKAIVDAKERDMHVSTNVLSDELNRVLEIKKEASVERVKTETGQEIEIGAAWEIL
jgi:hypothetical protein